ncbi:MAG: polymer-forming cytoskeletal protein [Litorimonas sp.]
MFNKSSGGSNGTAPDSAPAKRASAPSASRMTNSPPSLLGQDLVITGDLKTDGEVQVDGRLEGNLTAGNITIGENGAVHGKIVGSLVHIRGKVTGKVEADSIELAETANVQADLIQDQLMIANGAFFDGKCARRTAAAKPAKAAKAE